MKTILLGKKGHFASVDDIDYENLSKHKWGVMKNHHTFYAYRRITVDGKRVAIQMHREILGAADDMLVDHVDGQGLNNVRSNLRLASRSQNTWNRRQDKRNTSGCRGVCWYPQKNRWQTWIMVHGKRKSLGNYVNFEDAVAARKAAEKENYGEFVRAEKE